MDGKAEELGILEYWPPLGRSSSTMTAFSWIEEQLARHATELPDGAFEPAHQRLHGLAWRELHPQEARVPEHDLQAIPLAVIYAKKRLEPSKNHIAFVLSRDSGNRVQTASDSRALVQRVNCVRHDDTVSNERFALGEIDVEGAEPLVF